MRAIGEWISTPNRRKVGILLVMLGLCGIVGYGWGTFGLALQLFGLGLIAHPQRRANPHQG